VTPFESPRYARVAGKLLARSLRPEGPLPIGDRPAAVAAVERALRARGHRRIWRGGLLAVAAAGVFLTAGLTMRSGLRQAAEHRPGNIAPPPSLTAVAIALSGEPATVARNGKSLEIGRAVTSVGLTAGDRMRTGPGARLAISLSTGTRLDLDHTSDLELSELGPHQQFVLRGGQVHAQVAKLSAGQRFLIHTPDAEVEVHGTAFEVELLPAGHGCADLPTTQVRVREGVVSVRGSDSEKRLGPGARWQTPCPTQPLIALPALPPAPLGQAALPRQKVARPLTPASTLPQELELFDAAVVAGSRGNTVRALRLLDELLLRYPTGAMADSALAERRKLRAGPLP
jgi:ferric-dicitrate binding protein FerR (iron transport regulator)